MLYAVGAELPQILREYTQPIKIILKDSLLQRTYKQDYQTRLIN